MAQILKIIDHEERFGPASLMHFTVEAGEQINAKIVLEHKHISLYCIDHAAQRLIFTDLPPDIDLTNVPFVYNAQMENATRFIAVSYDELTELTSSLTLPENILLVYSTGRAGSTLMSQILNEIDNVVSFSEPDVFLNLVPIIYHADNRHDYNYLVEHCFKLFMHQYADKTVAIKFRGECIDIADVIRQVLPSAKNLYLYRHTIEWASSWWRVFSGFGGTGTRSFEQASAYGINFTGRISTLKHVIGDNTDDVSFVSFITSLYLFYLEGYFRAHEQGVPFMAMRYQDLNNHREIMLTKLFDYVGLPQTQLASALNGFERDSQAGTALERKNDKGNTERLNDESVKIITDILSNHPLKLTPEIILPSTIHP